MVEYHGWATINIPWACDDPKLHKTVALLKSQIEMIAGHHRIIGLEVVNGTYILWADGVTNHWGEDIIEILDLYSLIASNTEEAYGLLYVWNNEDNLRNNEFRVWKLARGKLVEMQDPFLSPCVPTIENAADWENM